MRIYPAAKYASSIKRVCLWGFDITRGCTKVGIWPSPIVNEGTIRGFGFVDLIRARSREFKTRRFYGPITLEFEEVTSCT